jgi:pyruvate/2-oxoglutarate dehydrogenase complex dihydrolipoamide dehydrogenase (E3) component
MAERAATSTRRCTVNPLIGREMEGDEVVPVAPERRRKVVVAGGGPGGLYAAWTAARRGHDVVLMEKEQELGGVLKSERALPFKHEMYELTGTYERFCRAAGVDIRLGQEATAASVEAEGADALIVAVGSTPLVPPIPGLDGPQVIVVNDYYLHTDEVADTVVVLGGGLAGCECAIHLAREGKHVALVEMRDALAPDANVRHRPLMLAEIARLGIDVRLTHQALAVEDAGVRCKGPEGEVLVPGQTVICALGQRSNTAAVEALADAALFVRVIGDAARVATITQAVYQGYYAALGI